MKQIFTLILTILLLCGMLVPVALATDETSVTTDNTTNDTVIDTDSGSSTDSDIPTIPTETAAPSDAGIITDGDESTGTEESSGVPTTVITLTRFDEPYRTDAVAFALGTSQEELFDWFADVYAGFTGYDADGNPYDLTSDAWSLDAVDTGTPGVYYAWTEPDLGEDYILADGVSLPRQLCAVTVQTPGEPDINCCVSGRGFLHFPWVLSAEQQEQLDEFAVWLRQDSGEWTRLSSGFYFTSDDLQLSQRIFEDGNTYELKVTYPGGQTGVLTFQYDGELGIIDYTEGDRDGGDVDGGSSGTGSQPAPAPSQAPSHSQDDDNPNSDDSSTPVQNNSSLAPNETATGSASTWEETPEEPATISNEPQEEPNSLSNESQQEQIPMSNKPVFITLAMPPEPAPEPSKTSSAYKSAPASAALGTENPKVSQPSEFYSPEQTVISGLRLRDLCAGEESVVFGSGDLTVSIPSELLLALNLSDSDTLSVKLTQPESNKIMLAVEASGKSIEDLSGTVLRLRYMPKSENAEITVWSQMGEQITDAAFDGEVLRFSVDAARTYTILEAPKSDAQKIGVSPLLPVSGSLILTAGGITLFRRKFHG